MTRSGHNERRMHLDTSSVRRSRWASAMLSALLAASLAACGSAGTPPSAAPEPRISEVRVALLPLGSTLPVHVADVKGIFERNGLRLRRTETQDATVLLPALAKGQYDLVLSVPTILLVGATKGLDVQVVSRMARSTAAAPGGGWITRDPAITSLEQLKGKTIGVPALTGQITDAVVYLLQQRGIDRKDVKFQQVPFPTMGDQLKAGRVDAVIAGIPYSTALAARGFHVHDDVIRVAVREASGGEVDAGTAALFVATSDYTRDHPDAIRAWRRSLNEAIDYLRAHEAEARTLMQTWLEMPPQLAQQAPLPNWQVELTPAELRPYVTISRTVGTIDREPDVDKLVWQDR
jgi:ABC-type nitrate/sulfonate/bicarbonate transport system substrate-binding protein